MKRDAVAFVSAFSMSALLGLFNLRCGDEDCSCPPPQSRPDPQGPLSTIAMGFADAATSISGFEFEPARARVSVGPDELIIEYEQGNVGHRVRYEVLPSM